MQDAVLDRRGFLTGSAAAVGVGSFGLVVGGGAIALAQPGTGDPILGAITDQLLAATARMQAAPAGEAGRQIAASLRLLATWGRAHGLDDRLRRALRAARRRRTEPQAVDPDIDAELTVRGWVLPPGVTGVVTRGDLSDTVDELLRGGITDHWVDFADAFDDAARHLDGRAKGVSRVSLQTPQECQGAAFMQQMLDTQAFVACTFTLWLPDLCVIMGAMALAWRWYMWSLNC